LAGMGPAMTPPLWITPRLGRWLIRPRAAEFDAVVQAERAVVPELELGRRTAPAAPARRARYFADDVLGRDLCNRLFERKTAFQRLRLLRGPGADLRLFGPSGKIGIGFGFADLPHEPADPDLPAQPFPIQ